MELLTIKQLVERYDCDLVSEAQVKRWMDRPVDNLPYIQRGTKCKTRYVDVGDFEEFIERQKVRR